MKNLYILRHSHTIQNHNTIADVVRPLDDHGVKFCGQIAKFMKENSISPELVLCSIARRTIQTVELIEQHLETQFTIEYLKDLYNTDVMNVYDVIRSINDSFNKILLVGHNPYVSQISNFLIVNNQPLLIFGPGNLAHIQFSIDKWNDIVAKSGTLRGFFHNEG